MDWFPLRSQTNGRWIMTNLIKMNKINKTDDQTLIFVLGKYCTVFVLKSGIKLRSEVFFCSQIVNHDAFYSFKTKIICTVTLNHFENAFVFTGIGLQFQERNIFHVNSSIYFQRHGAKLPDQDRGNWTEQKAPPSKSKLITYYVFNHRALFDKPSAYFDAF